MFKQKRTFQTSWKEKILWVEASGRLITPAILSRWIVNFRRHFLLCTCISGSLISTRLPAIMLIAQDKMKSRFYKIKCTAVSDQVLNCQPKIVILINTPSLSYYYWGGGGGESVQQILFPPFRYSGPVDSWCSSPGPVPFWKMF